MSTMYRDAADLLIALPKAVRFRRTQLDLPISATAEQMGISTGQLYCLEARESVSLATTIRVLRWMQENVIQGERAR